MTSAPVGVSVIVATIGRSTLPQSIKSAVDRLPVSEILIAPAPDVVLPPLPVSARVEVLRQTTNLYAAWNLAVSAARAKHVFFLNDDDLLEGPPLEPMVLNSGGAVNIRLRLEGRRTRSSVSAARGNGRIAPLDLFHANHAGNINSFLWPRELFRRFGTFPESMRIRGDIDWMQRLVGADLDVQWLDHPTYVQSRGADRLSSWSRDRPELIAEAVAVVESIQKCHGQFSWPAALGHAWVGTLRLKSLISRP